MDSVRSIDVLPEPRRPPGALLCRLGLHRFRPTGIPGIYRCPGCLGIESRTPKEGRKS